MNPTIQLIQQHRSIRKYKSDPLPAEALETIIRAAQAASTSSNVQAYSVIAVTDPEKKRALSAIAGNQPYIEQCPVFLVWCADLYRNQLACRKHDRPMISGTMENLLVATIDVALAAQNAAIAAESLGLGIVYIGGVRNDLRAVSSLLNLPKLVYPVFGMCLGYPDQEPGQRPRLPLRTILHQETYHQDQAQLDAIEEYDEVMRQYYVERTQGKRETTWSKEIAQKYSKPVRKEVTSFLKEQGFHQEDER